MLGLVNNIAISPATVIIVVHSERLECSGIATQLAATSILIQYAVTQPSCWPGFRPGGPQYYKYVR